MTMYNAKDCVDCSLLSTSQCVDTTTLRDKHIPMNKSQYQENGLFAMNRASKIICQDTIYFT